MTVNQLLKWRRDILMGKNKYYPKNLITNLIAFNTEYKDRDKVHEEINLELAKAEAQSKKEQESKL